MGAHLLACNGQAIDDGTLKQLFYCGVLGGPYYNCLKSTLHKLQEARGTKTVEGIQFALCTTLELAQCLDKAMRNPSNGHFNLSL
jgi:hypothetical protein